MNVRVRAKRMLLQLGRLKCSSCGTTLVKGGVTMERQAELDCPDLCRGCWLEMNGLPPGSTVGRRRRDRRGG